VVADQGPKRQKGWGRRGGWAFSRKNMTVYMPLNTAWVRFRVAGDVDGIPDPRLSDIDLKVADMSRMEAALQQARNVLLVTHNGIEDFNFRTQENQIESINKQIQNARMSGGIIAGISLLVGGIGIMNIMLASVTERTREIGIRLAVGARGRDVLRQFLTEAVLLSVMGGALGIATGFWLAPLLTKFFQFPTLISNTSVILAFSVSAIIGVVFGFFPALKAANLDPIDALRYE